MITEEPHSFLSAAFEIFACALCSGDTCELQDSLTHQSHQAPASGDQSLCCCSHLLVVSAVRVEPYVIRASAPESVLTPAPLVHQSAVFHPPRALAL
jgi:hypothetical protein